MLCIILLFCLFFTLSYEVYPTVVSMDILNSSTRKLVTSVEFSKAPYSSTLTRLHGRFYSSILKGRINSLLL